MLSVVEWTLLRAFPTPYLFRAAASHPLFAFDYMKFIPSSRKPLIRREMRRSQTASTSFLDVADTHCR
jgi:hypothetical protein